MNAEKELKQGLEKGDLAQIKRAVANGADIYNSRFEDLAFSPLELAIRDGWDDIAEYFIDSQVDINAVDRYGSTPLFFSIANGRRRIFTTLLEERAHVNLQNIYGQTPLSLAARSKDMYFIDRLIKAGAEVNFVDNVKGETASHAAVRCGNLSALEKLIKAKADLNRQDRQNGYTPLHLTIKCSAISAPTLGSNSPLYDSVALVETLLKGGADFTVRDKRNRTPEEFAMIARQYEVAAVLKYARLNRKELKELTEQDLFVDGAITELGTYISIDKAKVMKVLKQRKLPYAMRRRYFLSIKDKFPSHIKNQMMKTLLTQSLAERRKADSMMQTPSQKTRQK